jgi:hypothetical protein
MLNAALANTLSNFVAASVVEKLTPASDPVGVILVGTLLMHLCAS